MPYEIILAGHVQGVGCRWYCSHAAQRMGLHGAASNLADGTVQVLLETEEPAIAHSYASALKENRFHLNFWGRIESADLSPVSVSVDGDYSW